MKRYKMVNSHGQSVFKYDGIIQKEDVAGEWVKFEDVEDLRSLVEESISELAKLKLAAISVKSDCNCREIRDNMSFEIIAIGSFICPTHGYKKL